MSYKKKINKISIYDLRQILKELGYSKYYDYTSYFFCKITGDELPSIPERDSCESKLYVSKNH